MSSVTKPPDYHDYSTLTEYAAAVKSAGYSLPALLGWVIQSTMLRRGCTFQVAMDDLVRTGAIVLIGGSGLPEGERNNRAIDVTQRLKDLDANSKEEIDRKKEERTEEGECQKGDGETEKPEDLPR
jgi:hypothetical protein